MQISPKIKKRLRWQNTFFVILFLTVIALLAFLSTRYEYESDWTKNRRNTPSEATLALLEKVIEPVHIQAFVSDSNKTLAAEIKHLIKTYQRFKPDISLEFIDPAREPEVVRKLGIRGEGPLIIKIKERTEIIAVATEQNLTNAIQRALRAQEQWILFLEGHGERSPYGDTNYDFSSWTKLMKSKGLLVRGYNLASNPNIPVNTAALVIADPQKNLLPGEVNILLDYIDKGGNLLWLLEPNNVPGLEPLAEALGIEPIQGMVVDPNTQLLGINDSRFTLVPEYPRNPITTDFNAMTIFPTAKAMEFYGTEDWDATNILETLPRTWSETEEFSPDMKMDAGLDIPGPLVIGVSLTRAGNLEDLDAIELDDMEITEADLLEPDQENSDATQNQQRIIIIGDNDFASDAYLGQAGNMDFAMNLINWLVKDDSFISIPNKTNNDLKLELSKSSQAIIGFSFLLIIPIGLLLTGLFIWYQRRKR